MARRERNTQATDTTPEVPTTVQEDTVSTTDEATPEVATEATEATPAATTEAKPEVVIDLTAFNASVAAAIEARDESTGDVPQPQIEAVTKEYRNLDGAKPKAAGRQAVEELMVEAMNSMNIGLARAYLNIQKTALTAATGGSGKASTPKTPVDPTEAFVQKVAGLRLALNLATADGQVPEGVSDEWADKAKALVAEHSEVGTALLAHTVSEAEDKGDAPEAPAFVQAAVKLALGKSGKVGSTVRATGTSTPFTGERRDVGKHLTEVFESVEPGTFLTVAQIKAKASSQYEAGAASAGAISARLFPKSGKFTVEGVEPGTDDDGKKGARKATPAAE